MALQNTVDFGWCLWLTAPPSHPWHGHTGNFDAHLSIATNLHWQDVYKSEVPKIQQDVKLSGPLYQTHQPKGFYAIVAPAVPLSTEIPKWWPEDAHISFAYRVSPFAEREILKLQEKIVSQVARLSGPVAVHCTGHWSNWCDARRGGVRKSELFLADNG